MQTRLAAHAMKKHTKEAGIDKAFNVLVYVFLTLAFVITIYPMIVVLSSSFSSSSAVLGGKVWLYPIGFNLEGYKAVFRNARIWTGYQNSVLYTVGGTLLNGVVGSVAEHGHGVETCVVGHAHRVDVRRDVFGLRSISFEFQPLRVDRGNGQCDSGQKAQFVYVVHCFLV